MVNSTDIEFPPHKMWLYDEAHQQWVHAFNWWFHSGKRSRIIENLNKGVKLSSKNSRFLAAILDGTVKPLSGKQGGVARFKNSIIDNKIFKKRKRGTKSGHYYYWIASTH